MGDRFEGYGVPRAFACVIRRGIEGHSELLVFDHPEAGTQIPKGRVDPGESHRAAAIRELAEESGLDLVPTRFIAAFEYEFLHPHTGESIHEDGYVWLFEAPTEVDESWIHAQTPTHVQPNKCLVRSSRRTSLANISSKRSQDAHRATATGTRLHQGHRRRPRLPAIGS